MPSVPTVELEARAERAVRRGELLHALELYESLLAERPEDDRVRSRMESVRALLQPSEMVSRRRTEPEEVEPAEGLAPLSDAEQGEMHASSGRFEEAVRCYDRALQKAPRNELLRERFEELRKLSPPSSLARHDGLDRAEKLDPFTPTAVPRLAVPAPARQAPPPLASSPAGPPLSSATRPAAPRSAAPRAAALPKDPIELLQALLLRVRESRRRPAAGA
jgi:tetratricopeptide (TPR) repeat protein